MIASLNESATLNESNKITLCRNKKEKILFPLFECFGCLIISGNTELKFTVE